jgi:hypothetical protein
LTTRRLASRLPPDWPQQVRTVERRLADDRLGVDQQPRLATGRQEIGKVRVSVHDDVVAIPCCKAAGEPSRFVDHLARQGMAESILLGRKMACPGRRQVPQEGKAVYRRRRPAKPAQDAGGDVQRLVAIGQVEKRRSGHEPLEQQRAGRRIVVKQSDRAIAVVEPQCVSFGAVFVIHEGQLQHRRRAVGAEAIQNQGVRRSSERLAG